MAYGFYNSIYLDFRLAEPQFFVTQSDTTSTRDSVFSVRYSVSWILYCLSWQTNPHFTGPYSCTVLVDVCSLVTPFFLTGLQSTNNPLKVVLRVPTRQHLIEQLSFPVVTQTTLVVAIRDIHPAAD
jgi:hypothetical protein